MAKKISEKEAKALFLKFGLEPIESYINSHTKIRCICIRCGRTVSPTLSIVKRGRSGCGYCSKKKVDAKEAEAWMLQLGLKPLIPFSPKSRLAWKSKCLKCGKIVSPKYLPRGTRKPPSCGYCSKVKVDEKDLNKRMKQNGFLPLEPYKNANSPWKCRCLTCGMVSHTRWSQVQFHDSRCKFCSRNAITEDEAIKRMKLAGYVPLEPFKSTKTKWKSKHIKCGELVSPKLGTITSGGGGCRTCCDTGFEVSKSAFVYFLYHPEHLSYKVGIGNHDSKPNRIRKHQIHGWILIKMFSFESGKDALNVETQFFQWLRTTKNVPIHLSKSDMKQSGWVETFSMDLIGQRQVIEKLRLLKKRC